MELWVALLLCAPIGFFALAIVRGVPRRKAGVMGVIVLVGASATFGAARVLDALLGDLNLGVTETGVLTIVLVVGGAFAAIIVASHLGLLHDGER
jgi:hypothetical protein